MTTEYFKGFDDLFDHISDPDFDFILEDYLDKMPHTRESAVKLLDAVSGWDILLIYRRLLTDYSDLLTRDEKSFLQAEYKKNFDIPLID